MIELITPRHYACSVDDNRRTEYDSEMLDRIVAGLNRIITHLNHDPNRLELIGGVDPHLTLTWMQKNTHTEGDE